MKPPLVRYIRLFCAAAVVTVAIAEILANTSNLTALGLGSAGGVVATIVAKKAALFA